MSQYVAFAPEEFVISTLSKASTNTLFKTRLLQSGVHGLRNNLCDHDNALG